jgi:hypothetical protein
MANNCPRKNGPVEDRPAFFSNSFLKLEIKIQKVEQFFSATKIRDTAPDCTKTPFALILLEFGFKRNVVKEKDF